MANMLRDVGTLSELQAWSERLEVAKHLTKGISYRQVAALTGASTTTVTRVARFIENGTGGYRKVLHAHRHHRLMKQSSLESGVSIQESSNQEPSFAPSELREGRPGTRNDFPGQQEEQPRPVSVLQKYLDRK